MTYGDLVTLVAVAHYFFHKALCSDDFCNDTISFCTISIAMVEEVSARFDDGREGVLQFNNEHEHAVLVKSAPTAELGCVLVGPALQPPSAD